MAILQVGTSPVQRNGLIDVLYRHFLKLVAAGCVLLALQYWAQLIGYSDGGLSRFDLLAPHWQLAAASLAVLFPVAAVGLWMEVSWGVVIWIVAAGLEVAMHTVFSEWFGPFELKVGLHIAVAATYLAFRISLYVRDKEFLGKVSSDSL